MTLRWLIAAVLVVAAGARAADLRIALSADVTSMDPHAVNIAPNNAIGWHVFDALTHVDEEARLVAGLAQSWRAVDPLTWEFHLRRGVKFHDGTDLAADDVVFSIERARTLPAGQYASFVSRITAQEAVDRHTVRVKTATPYAMVPYDLNSIFIVSARAAKTAATEDFNLGRAMVGTGPFKFVRFARGDRVELEKNPSYWGGVPAWDKLTFRIMPTDPARIAALLSNEVDVIDNVPTPDIAKLKANARFTITQKTSWRTIFFHLDQARDQPPGVGAKGNPFKDVRVRQAISKAINRTAIVDRVMEGAAIPAANLVSPSVFGHASELKPEPYDPEGAKKLLAEAGYAQGFSLVLAAPNNRYLNDDQIAQAVAQMLARVGITAKIETMPIAAYLPRARKRDFGFAMLGWGSYSADLALRANVASNRPALGYGSWNWSGYSNPEIDRLLDQAFTITDPAKREPIAREAMVKAMRDYAVIPLHHQAAVWATKAGLAYAGRTDEYTLAHQIRSK